MVTNIESINQFVPLASLIVTVIMLALMIVIYYRPRHPNSQQTQKIADISSHYLVQLLVVVRSYLLLSASLL